MARDNSGSKNEPQYSASSPSSQAADLTEVGSYAAFVGNRKVGPTTGTATGPGGANTGRTTSTGADVWEGLLWRDTTDGFTYEYRSGAWVRIFDDTGWINVAPVGTTGGTAPVFQNSWQNFGGAYQGARFRRVNGMVYMQGQIKGGSPVTGSNPIFFLPAGFRPAAYLVFTVWGNGAVNSIEISSADGRVVPGDIALTPLKQSITIPPFLAES